MLGIDTIDRYLNPSSHCFTVYAGGGGSTSIARDICLDDEAWQFIEGVMPFNKTCLPNNPELVDMEKRALKKAVATFERAVSRRAGTQHDVGGWVGNRLMDCARHVLFPETPYDKLNFVELTMLHILQSGQQDCVDETLTVEQFVLQLQAAGLLCYFSIDPSQPEISMTNPEHVAVRLLKNGETWALDSWINNNGMQPALLPAGKWEDTTRNSMPDMRCIPPR